MEAQCKTGPEKILKAAEVITSPLFYCNLLPHEEQNLPPVSGAPHLLQPLGGATALPPQLGQKFPLTEILH